MQSSCLRLVVEAYLTAQDGTFRGTAANLSETITGHVKYRSTNSSNSAQSSPNVSLSPLKIEFRLPECLFCLFEKGMTFKFLMVPPIKSKSDGGVWNGLATLKYLHSLSMGYRPTSETKTHFTMTWKNTQILYSNSNFLLRFDFYKKIFFLNKYTRIEFFSPEARQHRL